MPVAGVIIPYGEGGFGEAMHELDKPQDRESYKAGSFSPESPLLWWKSGDDWQQFSYTLGEGETSGTLYNRFFPKDEQA